MSQFNAELLSKIRTQNPLIHNITNIVSAHFSANGLLAIGASPFMSSSLDEMEEIAAISSGLVINMGGVSDRELAAMLACGRMMNTLGKPVILDPVGAGATPHRQKVVRTLLQEIRFDAIRGNAGEIAFLAGTDLAVARRGRRSRTRRFDTACQNLCCPIRLHGCHQRSTRLHQRWHNTCHRGQWYAPISQNHRLRLSVGVRGWGVCGGGRQTKQPNFLSGGGGVHGLCCGRTACRRWLR